MPGFWRWAYYQLGIEYNSYNDIPSEKDVKLKQVCMRQISLSKVKLNHVDVKERTPPDLEKIQINPEFKIQYKNKCVIVERSEPIPITQKDNNEWFKSRSRIF